MSRAEVHKSTQKKFIVTLGSIFKYAVRKRYCDFNPVREIEKPRVSKQPIADFLNSEEIRALIENTKVNKYKALFTLAVMSGMR